ncbi:MAG: HAD family phosphatase [Roseiflexus sp.]|nr:HAD family phosphatase [Roseiflexus sp.]MCS7290755.1 HAD family phosphatase [Roseiflexus sp.]MDW8146211.1 HAD family phosphatase [Roseiflexaceae bacterium]MDW8231384.1 HAD family phosphatase [Roseiflexaceae bacterium]
MTDFTAAIFDMDGTLLNNMPLYYRAFRMFLERHGLRPPPPSEAVRLIGKRQSDIFPALFGRALTPEEIARYTQEAGRLYREMLVGVKPLPGLLRFLDTLKQQGVRIGLATSAPRENVAPTLAALDIADRFDAITLGDEVPRGKPAPDIFLEAARRLGQPADRCVVFEDSHAGIAAARAAGMRCVALATTHTADELRSAGPDLIVADYDELLRVMPPLLFPSRGGDIRAS